VFDPWQTRVVPWIIWHVRLASQMVVDTGEVSGSFCPTNKRSPRVAIVQLIPSARLKSRNVVTKISSTHLDATDRPRIVLMDIVRVVGKIIGPPTLAIVSNILKPLEVACCRGVVGLLQHLLRLLLVVVSQSKRIEAIDRIIVGIRIKVGPSTRVLDRIFAKKTARNRIVISGAVVVQTGFGIELATRVLEPIRD